jgi:hypothetical protein
VADVFYVREAGGGKVGSAARQAELRDALVRAAGPAAPT